MGLGASHQTGWTGLVAKLIQQHAEYTLQHRAHEVKPVFGQRAPASAPPGPRASAPPSAAVQGR